MMDKTAQEAGVSKGRINQFVIDLFNSNKQLCIGALLARGLANCKGVRPSKDSALFHEIASQLKVDILRAI